MGLACNRQASPVFILARSLEKEWGRLFTLQRIVGYGLILFGIIMSFTGVGINIGVTLMFAGFVLVSLAEMVRIMRGTYLTTLGLPPTKEQLHTIISHSPKWLVSSNSLTIYPNNDTEYPVIHLHGEQYIRSRVFRPYMEQTEMEYRFSFPGREPIIMNCTTNYSPGVDLFEFNDQVFVKLSELPLIHRIEGDRYLNIEVIPATNG